MTRRAIYSCIALVAIYFTEVALADKVKLGIIAPLTGIGADYGVAIKNGAILSDGKVRSSEELVERLRAVNKLNTVKGSTSVVLSDGVRHFNWPIVLRNTR